MVMREGAWRDMESTSTENMNYYVVGKTRTNLSH